MPPSPRTDVFADLPGPRRDVRNERHELTDILSLATRAVPGGADSREAVAECGRTKVAFARR